MGTMGTADGRRDMQMYGSTAPPTAGQVQAAARLISETDVSLKRYANVQAAFAAGYTYVLRTNGEEHLLYDGDDPGYQGLNPQDPSSLVYAINVPDHAPILLGAMYIMGDQQSGPQIGGGLTRWHSHLVTCVSGRQTIAGFGVQLRGGCDPATWQDRYTAQMLHVWVVPYPGGVFSDDLSAAATSGAGPGRASRARLASPPLRRPKEPTCFICTPPLVPGKRGRIGSMVSTTSDNPGMHDSDGDVPPAGINVGAPWIKRLLGNIACLLGVHDWSGWQVLATDRPGEEV